MTTYQRGNRDGCLSIAAWATEQATTYEAEYERLAGLANKAGRSDAPFLHNLWRAEAFREIAALAALRSQALPDEPAPESSR